MFIQIRNDKPYGHPVTYENMRQLIPNNVSLPIYPLTKDILVFGFAVYEFAQKPNVNSSDFKVVEEDKPKWASDDIRGDYVTQVWTIRDMTKEESNQHLTNQWNIIRDERDDKLLRTDWTQLPNAKLTEEQKIKWEEYRQELRDITLQEDPFNIIWPEMSQI